MRALIILIIWFGAELDQLAAQKLKVLATASMWKDIAEQIGGPFVQVDLIVPIGSDPHSYEPTPDDLFKVNEAQLIFVSMV
ncbi:MAG: zinc ABC transporter substrate-binding protein [Saprospiraceae bacterium]|nr:zinc ABC transporter substrate-binding protein [Saprospiraceae bacterium]